MPTTDQNSSPSAVPGIAICGLIMVGGISTLLSMAGFLCGLTLAGTTLKGAEAAPLLTASALMMGVAAGSFAWLLHICFRKM